MFNNLSLLKEDGIPAEFLTRTRAWFLKNMNRLEQIHGAKWEGNRAWLADYLNGEVMELIKHADKRTTHRLDS